MSKYVVEVHGKLSGTSLQSEEELVDYLVGEGVLEFKIFECVGEYQPVVQKKEIKTEENV